MYNVKCYLQNLYKMKRIFYVDEVKKMIQQLDNEEITLSRFVEILNEKATGLSAIELSKLEDSVDNKDIRNELSKVISLDGKIRNDTYKQILNRNIE